MVATRFVRGPRSYLDPRRFCLGFLIAAALLWAPAHRLSAQVRGAAEDRVVAVFFSVENLDEVGITEEGVALLRSGFFTSLASDLDGYAFVPAGSDDRDAVAVSLGADAWVAVELEPSDDAIQLSLSVKDLYYADPGSSIHYDIPLSANFRGNTGRYWFQAVDFVGSRLLSADYETQLFLVGEPHARVVGLGPEPLVLGPDGTAELFLPFGESFHYESRVKRHHDVASVIQTRAPEMTLLIHQPSFGGFSIEGFLTGFSYPGVGVSLHLLRSWTLVRFDLFTYAVGLIPYAEQGTEGGSFFASDPASHATVWLLQHLTPVRSRVRPYLGVGATARLLHSEGFLQREPVAPRGLTAALGLELPKGYGAWFFEYAPLFYLVDEPELWDAQLEGGDFGYLRIGDNALDLLMVRAGFRYTPPGWR